MFSSPLEMEERVKGLLSHQLIRSAAHGLGNQDTWIIYDGAGVGGVGGGGGV